MIYNYLKSKVADRQSVSTAPNADLSLVKMFRMDKLLFIRCRLAPFIDPLRFPAMLCLCDCKVLRVMVRTKPAIRMRENRAFVNDPEIS